jgi:cytochrome P450
MSLATRPRVTGPDPDLSGVSPRRSPPGPRSRFPGQITLAYWRDPPGALTDAAREFGDVVFFRLGPWPIYMFNHPDHVHEVLLTQQRHLIKGRGLRLARRIVGEGLLTSEGDFHRRQRRLAQPAFHHQRIQAYAGLMADYARRMGTRWQEGDSIDLYLEMLKLTVAIGNKTLFNLEPETEGGRVCEALVTGLSTLSPFTNPLYPLFEKLPLPSHRRFRQAQERLEALIYQLIRDRRAGGEDPGDLLSMLMEAQDVEADGGRMTDAQLYDEVVTLLVAGHDATATLLAWTWDLLARHPRVEAALHAELDAVLEGRPPAFADLPRLTYTKMVLAETLRLRPPAWLVSRQATTDLTIGGYAVPAGAYVYVSPYVMHRDPRYFPEPERFVPERWTPEFEAGLPRFAYFPFGGGERICIGQPLAKLEGVVALAALAQDWQLRPVSARPVRPLPQITLRPESGVAMRLLRRRR